MVDNLSWQKPAHLITVTVMFLPNLHKVSHSIRGFYWKLLEEVYPTSDLAFNLLPIILSQSMVWYNWDLVFGLFVFVTATSMVSFLHFLTASVPLAQTMG